MSNEAKTTKAYKVSPELKEKLERLAVESGLDTQEAFIEHLAALYELQRLKEGNGSGYAKQLEELEYHLRRPLDLFIGMVETEAAARLQQTQQHDETLAARAATILAQEQELAESKKIAKMLNDELVALSKEYETQTKLVEQLGAAVQDKAALVEEYRSKNDTLAGLVNDYKTAADENKALAAEVSRLTVLTDKQGEHVLALEGDLKALDELRAEQLRQAEERQTAALERLSERKDVEREREILALRTEYQAKLEAAQTEATARLRELYDQRDALRERIQQFQQLKDDGDGKSKK